MKGKIIITAANGFMGKALVKFFNEKYEVVALVRKHTTNELPNVNYVLWDGKTLGEWSNEFEGAKAIINLAGRSVDCRYNDKNKQEIYSSRLDSTTVIGEAIKQCKLKPTVWLNAASATIYRHSTDKPMTEKEGEYGTGFSVDVCQQWEKCFYHFNDIGVRQIALRTAIVLGKQGGVMKPFSMLTKLGLGGKMANGNQMFSWIHIDDVCLAIAFLINNKNATGSYNICSPNPIANSTFMKQLRAKHNIPFGIPQPKWLLEFGARLIKTETELILKSRYVIPKKLLNDGYVFKFENIQDCLEEIIILNKK
jgi:uncharacterized protein (TIGR01777 family)